MRTKAHEETRGRRPHPSGSLSQSIVTHHKKGAEETMRQITRRRLPVRQVDVFTTTPLAGNPLAVVLHASQLSGEEMQRIAREMNLSETTFVLPPTAPDATYRMRIFTPETEIPFAGHPSIGTAFVLAEEGAFALREPATVVRQEIGIGVLPIELRAEDGRVDWVVMTQGQPMLQEVVDVGQVARLLGLEPTDITDTGLPPQVASTGLRQLMVPVRDLGLVQDVRPSFFELRDFLADRRIVTVTVFSRETLTKEAYVHARVFAPEAGIPEDPATGSAAGALGAYLAHWNELPSDEPTVSFTIEQGYEINRPSTIWVEVTRDQRMPTRVRVGGAAVTVLRGELIV